MLTRFLYDPIIIFPKSVEENKAWEALGYGLRCIDGANYIDSKHKVSGFSVIWDFSRRDEERSQENFGTGGLISAEGQNLQRFHFLSTSKDLRGFFSGIGFFNSHYSNGFSGERAWIMDMISKGISEHFKNEAQQEIDFLL
tara:strand:+ start:66 stop:488 length:423 start_codon:yes stop_codon:yes gene_type:complete